MAIKLDFNKHHPEIKVGEIFLTNSRIDTYKEIQYKTKRLGLFTFTPDGELFKSSNNGVIEIPKEVILYPVFVKKYEYEVIQNEYKNVRF